MIMCSKCGEKPRNGKSSWCQECKKEGDRKWYQNNKDKVKQRVKEWATKNPDKRAAIAHKSYEKHQEKRSAYQRNRHNSKMNADPDYFRKRNLKIRYGMSDEDYNNMLLSQGNSCAICGIMSELVVDHDHSSGIIRGLLCQRCNKAMGHFRDDVSLMQKAIDYLKRSK